MKVNGTGQPPNPGVSGPEAPDKTLKKGDAAEVGKASTPGKAFAEKLAGTRPTQSAEVSQASRPNRIGEPTRTSPATRAGAIPVSDVAADLRAGKVTPQAAIQTVVDRVVARQVGPDAPPALRDSVRAALQDAVDGDPLLAEKLRRL